MSEKLKQTIFVNGLVHNADQAVLAVRRSLRDHYLPGYLELPGGRSHPGESLERALDRKLQQELGISGQFPLYFTSLAQDDAKGPYLRVVFEVKYNPSQVIKLSGMHSEYKWLTKADLNNEKFAGNTKEILLKYLGEVVADRKAVDKNTTYIVYTDGGSRGNPGPSASAYVIYNNQRQILESGGSYIGITSNNQAEYTAVLLALKALADVAQSTDTILFNLDSLLVVNQMNGLYKIKNRELWPLNQQIRDLMKQFKEVRFNHVPRENNTEADLKVNQILDAHSKIN